MSILGSRGRVLWLWSGQLTWRWMTHSRAGLTDHAKAKLLSLRKKNIFYCAVLWCPMATSQSMAARGMWPKGHYDIPNVNLLNPIDISASLSGTEKVWEEGWRTREWGANVAKTPLLDSKCYGQAVSCRRIRSSCKIPASYRRSAFSTF